MYSIVSIMLSTLVNISVEVELVSDGVKQRTIHSWHSSRLVMYDGHLYAAATVQDDNGDNAWIDCLRFHKLVGKRIIEINGKDKNLIVNRVDCSSCHGGTEVLPMRAAYNAEKQSMNMDIRLSVVCRTESRNNSY